MPRWSAPQQFFRYPIVLPVQHSRPKSRVPTGTGVGWTRNLSDGGACLELAERLRPRMSLHLRFPTAHGAIDTEARVIWNHEMPAAKGGILHGVAFTHLSPDQHQALRDLLLSQRHEHRAWVRLPVTLAVTCQVRGDPGPALCGRTGDLSRGGLLLRLAQALPASTVLEITLHPPRGPITAEGEIAWVDPGYRQTFGEPIRHGVHLTTLAWSTSLSLGLVLAESV